MSIQKIKLLIFDCDGVLTDGKIVYDNNLVEAKEFSSHDGLGFTILRFSELKTAVITGRSSALVDKRCQDMKVDFVRQGVQNKLVAAEEIKRQLGLEWDEIAYMGDDWNDYPLIGKVGFSVSPANANKDFRQRTDFTTHAQGGYGAAREFIDYVLKAQGVYEDVLEKYLRHITA